MAPTRTSLIYLTGFMGSGKSTIGPILANTIGYAHTDLDREIERVTQQKITDLFFQEGEQAFRIRERDILRQTRDLKRHVVSLGGGTIADDENFELIRTSGLLVYLKTDPEQIFQRLKHKRDRPVLRSPEGKPLADDELREKIRAIFQAREPYYNRAAVIVETGTQRVGLTVDTIVQRISHFIE